MFVSSINGIKRIPTPICISYDLVNQCFWVGSGLEGNTIFLYKYANQQDDLASKSVLLNKDKNRISFYHHLFTYTWQMYVCNQETFKR